MDPATKVNMLTKSIQEQRQILYALEDELKDAQRELYKVTFVPAGGMELSFISVKVNGEEVLPLQYGWSKDMSVSEAAGYLLSECLRRGTVRLTNE